MWRTDENGETIGKWIEESRKYRKVGKIAISLHIRMYIYRPSNCCFFSLLGPLWVLSQPCRSCSCVVSCHIFMKLFYGEIKWWWWRWKKRTVTAIVRVYFLITLLCILQFPLLFPSFPFLLWDSDNPLYLQAYQQKSGLDSKPKSEIRE